MMETTRKHCIGCIRLQKTIDEGKCIYGEICDNVVRNLANPDTNAILTDVRKLVDACIKLVDVSKKTNLWNLVCDEEIEFENALKKVSKYFS